MEIYTIEHLNFTYPNRTKKALNDISFSVAPGEFITLCGKSGCGKTTLLRLLKSTLAPFGTFSGSIAFQGQPLSETDQRQQAGKIGFVLQNPDNQIVTDTVWHELAFGLESLGYTTPQIRTKVAEMASFFGITEWFHKSVTTLSGGQKQILNLAAVMVLQPSVLILDEPASQLDPIAAGEFLKMLEKINRELSTTIILSEHRLEEAFPLSDRVIVLDHGSILADGTPAQIATKLKAQNHDMYLALPTPMRVHGAVENDLECPLTVRDGRCWLADYAKTHTLLPSAIPAAPAEKPENPVITLDDVWFRYEKNLPDVIRGMQLKINRGELFALLGGNGAGKTTALSLISGIKKPYRGKVRIYGEEPAKIPNLYHGILGVLPQNPQTLFVQKTVRLDLLEMLSGKKIPQTAKEEKIQNIAALCRIEKLLENHPYDLSGGEQQRAALAKVLLTNPQILLLDEPTKGMDSHFKQIFADILADLQASGVTIVMVSHDIAFCAEHADRCALMFDGSITAMGTARTFFAGNSFYTTAANRMARTILPDAILAEDIILACGGTVVPHERTKPPVPIAPVPKAESKSDKLLTPKRIIAGCLFAVLFVLGYILQFSADTDLIMLISLPLTTAGIAGCFYCLLPHKKIGIEIRRPQHKQNSKKRTIIASLLILLTIPLTIFAGIVLLGDRKYYFISLLIILETLIPFCMLFEGRKPQARELVLISVLCAIAVAGRAAFFALPQFKPVAALIILTGICLGSETGFLVGAVTGFVSNFFFGQGPLTPWQMFAFGVIGFIAGILFRKCKTKTTLCICGFFAVLILYGGIMNPAAVLVAQPNPTWEMILSAYAVGLPFDLIHAGSTAFFLWFLAEPMLDKLERIKLKYGLIAR